jgi:hypothetical protein
MDYEEALLMMKLSRLRMRLELLSALEECREHKHQRAAATRTLSDIEDAEMREMFRCAPMPFSLCRVPSEPLSVTDSLIPNYNS